MARPNPGLFAALLLSLLLLLPAPAAAEQTTSVADLEDEIMCVVCGTLLGLSQAPAADQQRRFIEREIARGQDKEQIKASLVEEYGPGVLALPEGEGMNLWAYLLPLVGLGLGAAGVVWAVYRWRRSGAGEANDGQAPGRPTGADAERLERELAEFED